MQKRSADASRMREEDKLRQLLPKAVELFTTGKGNILWPPWYLCANVYVFPAGKDNSRSFQKEHIKSILVLLFATSPPKSGPGSRKGEMMKLLNDAVQKDPSKIANYTPPAAPHESSLPPPLPNVNARWLYERISESRSAGKMGDNIP